MVYAILSYAKWEQNTPNICIVNNPVLAQQFKSQRSAQHVYKISPLQLDDLKQTSCQAIVFSNSSPRERTEYSEQCSALSRLKHQHHQFSL
ncbi:YfiR/HmsC family protein [Acinetobacter indicus]